MNIGVGVLGLPIPLQWEEEETDRWVGGCMNIGLGFQGSLYRCSGSGDRQVGGCMNIGVGVSGLPISMEWEETDR